MKSEVFRFKTEASQWLKKHGKPVEVVGRKALRNFLRNRKLKCEPPLTVHQNERFRATKSRIRPL